MAHDVTQWLAEIRTLQQQLQELRQERDQAYASAANWRRLYDSEAAQRRQESEQSQLRIWALSEEVETYRGRPAPESELEDVINTVNEIEASDELRSQLIDALRLCDHLSRNLKKEQAEHEQTRQSLTTALGDAVDLLAKEPNGSSASTDGSSASTEAS